MRERCHWCRQEIVADPDCLSGHGWITDDGDSGCDYAPRDPEDVDHSGVGPHATENEVLAKAIFGNSYKEKLYGNS